MRRAVARISFVPVLAWLILPWAACALAAPAATLATADEATADEATDAPEGDEPDDDDAVAADPSDGKPADRSTPAGDNDDEEAKDEDAPRDDEPADEDRPAEKPVKLHVVETKDLSIELELDGVFVATETDEVALRPKVWTSFKVVRAVPHGARVSKGEPIVEFDDADIEESIAERELQLRVGEVALREAEEEFPRLERSIELDYDEAKRAYDQAREEYDRFQKTMRELSKKLADYYLKSAEQDLANAREELEQLEKMYLADELTEETEEIVLKRQKFQVEVAEFSLEYSQVNHEYTLDVAIPQRELMLTNLVEQTRLAYERAKMARSLGLSKERYDLDALREARARSIERHAKLVADRALMTLRAPRDGIVYYGRCVNGRWMEVGGMESKLVPFGTVAPNTVVATIVERLPMYVETGVGEKEYPTVKAGQSVRVKPVSDADVELTARVDDVADIPGSGNKFTIDIELTVDDDPPEWLMPGMTCKASIVTYEAEEAVVIPAELLQADEDDADRKYVMVLTDDAKKPVRRDLKLGKTKDKQIEILDGLAAGDRIVEGAKDDGDVAASDD